MLGGISRIISRLKRGYILSIGLAITSELRVRLVGIYRMALMEDMSQYGQLYYCSWPWSQEASDMYSVAYRSLGSTIHRLHAIFRKMLGVKGCGAVKLIVVVGYSIT